MATAFTCVLSTVESDSHFWNLIYLEKLLQEHGAVVRNLGACTPNRLVVDELATRRPDLLVVSSINGHGYYGARDLLAEIQQHGIEVPCVIGGKLTTSPSDDDRVRADLLARGFTDVFLGEDAIPRFREFLGYVDLPGGFAAWRPANPVTTPWDDHAPVADVVGELT